jgi:hypothetical protein
VIVSVKDGASGLRDTLNVKARIMFCRLAAQKAVPRLALPAKIFRRAPAFIRSRKFTFDFALASHDRLIGIPGVSKHVSTRTGIGKKFHRHPERQDRAQRAVASLAKSDHPVKDYVRVLMAVVLNRSGDAR